MRKSVGGFIQLIIPSEEMTWEEYKKKYGIDLDEIFEINERSNIRFRPEINKPILISGYENAYPGTSYGALPGCGFLTMCQISDQASSYSLGLYLGNPDAYAYGVVLNYSKTSHAKTIAFNEI